MYPYREVKGIRERQVGFDDRVVARAMPSDETIEVQSTIRLGHQG